MQSFLIIIIIFWVRRVKQSSNRSALINSFCHSIPPSWILTKFPGFIFFVVVRPPIHLKAISLHAHHINGSMDAARVADRFTYTEWNSPLFTGVPFHGYSYWVLYTHSCRSIGNGKGILNFTCFPSSRRFFLLSFPFVNYCQRWWSFFFLFFFLILYIVVGISHLTVFILLLLFYVFISGFFPLRSLGNGFNVYNT